MKTTNYIKLLKRMPQGILILCIGFGALQAKAEVSSQQRQALVDIYYATQGETWSQTWDLSKPISTWYGVTVLNTKVIALHLPNNGLRGSLPASLGQLSDLITLNLHKNQLKGTVPTALGTILTLKSLNLSLNQLEGTLPKSLALLSNLEHLDIYFNKFTGDLWQITGSLKKLKRISSFSNEFNPKTGLSLNSSIPFQHMDHPHIVQTLNKDAIKQVIKEVRAYQYDRPTSTYMFEKEIISRLA